MLLTPCVMEWTVLAVLSLCLPVWADVQVVQPYRVVSTDGTARVQCFVRPQPIQPPHTQNLPHPDPEPEPEELRVTLLKGLHGSQELCSSMLNITEHRETGVERKGEVRCSAHLREGAVEVTVSGLRAADTDVYRCDMEVFYPPPYLRLSGNGTLIHVLDTSACPAQAAQRQTAHRGDEEQDDEEGEERTAPVTLPVVVLMILVIVVLVLVISVQILQCKQGRREIIRAVPSVCHKVDVAAFSCQNIA